MVGAGEVVAGLILDQGEVGLEAGKGLEKDAVAVGWHPFEIEVVPRALGGMLCESQRNGRRVGGTAV